MRMGEWKKRTVAFRDLQLNTGVLGKIPLPLIVRGTLAGESGPAEGFDVEIAMEASDGLIFDIEIGLRLPASYAVVAICPVVRRPFSAIQLVPDMHTPSP